MYEPNKYIDILLFTISMIIAKESNMRAFYLDSKCN